METGKGKIMNTYFVNDAKIEIMDKARHKGADCPVCGQFVKVYKRTINASMAAQLIRADRQFGIHHTFHINEILEGDGGGADFAKMRYWGLIEEIKNDNPKKKNSGRWIITVFGRSFIMGHRKMPKYALIYNGRFLDFDGDETVTIQEALGNKFHYQDLLNS